MTASRLALAGLLVAGVASANGRPPQTNGVTFSPTDPASIYVRSTFGLLVSHDRGCSFEWVCEQNVGYGGIFDPTYAIAADGAIFATTFNGLRVSRDAGCSFTTATSQLAAGDPGRIADRYVATIDIADDGAIWVATADNGMANDVFVSSDNGATFAPSHLESPTIAWVSVRAAASDARRIYAAGYEVASLLADGGTAPLAHLRRSDDRGTSWTVMPLAGVATAPTPQLVIAAIDPNDAGRVFVVSIGANDQGDRLYRSTDGAMTFREVLATTDPITGVVIRDAQTVLAATRLGGSFRSDDAGATFAPIANSPLLGCLGLGHDMLVGCGPDHDQFAIGSSTDGLQWTRLFQLHDLGGPLDCPPGTLEYDVCNQQLWRTLQQQLGAKSPACAAEPPDAGVMPRPRSGGCCDADAGSIAWTFAVGVLVALNRRRHASTRRRVRG